VKALVVYNSNPAAVAPDRNASCAGSDATTCSRWCSSTFKPTPPTGPTSCSGDDSARALDLHLAYGHHYASLNRPSIAPIGEALPNSEIFRRIATRWDARSVLRDDDLTMIKRR